MFLRYTMRRSLHITITERKMRKMQYPCFTESLRQLAATNRERAKLLGVCERSIVDYLNGTRLPPVEKVKRFAALDDALTRDIRGPSAQIPA